MKILILFKKNYLNHSVVIFFFNENFYLDSLTFYTIILDSLDFIIL